MSQLRDNDPTFPRPGMHTGNGSVWHAAGIECWAAAHRPGRPESGGRFVGDCGSLLLAAERHGGHLGLHWIDSGLFWLVVSHGDAGQPLRTVLMSLGMTSAEIETELNRWRGTDDRPKRRRAMNPALQTLLAAADRRVAEEGRSSVKPIDLLLAFIDARPVQDHRFVNRPADHILDAFRRRGLDIAELRRRLVAVDKDPFAAAALEARSLRRRRQGRSRRPAGLDLSPNPLGHDPSMRWPWGAAFARTRDGRHLKVDGEVWFFTVDGDGFYVRAADGRPVGYRYRIEPKPRLRPVNGFMEILPMPPVEMADWPDRRYDPDD